MNELQMTQTGSAFSASNALASTARASNTRTLTARTSKDTKTAATSENFGSEFHLALSRHPNEADSVPEGDLVQSEQSDEAEVLAMVGEMLDGEWLADIDASGIPAGQGVRSDGAKQEPDEAATPESEHDQSDDAPVIASWLGAYGAMSWMTEAIAAKSEATELTGGESTNPTPVNANQLTTAMPLSEETAEASIQLLGKTDALTDPLNQADEGVTIPADIPVDTDPADPAAGDTAYGTAQNRRMEIPPNAFTADKPMQTAADIHDTESVPYDRSTPELSGNVLSESRAAVKATTGQAEPAASGAGAADDDSIDPKPYSLGTLHTAPPSVAETASRFTKAGETTLTYGTDFADKLSATIRSEIPDDGEKTFSLALKPDGLGGVTITLRHDAQRLEVIISTDRASTGELIKKELEALRVSLNSDAGKSYQSATVAVEASADTALSGFGGGFFGRGEQSAYRDTAGSGAVYKEDRPDHQPAETGRPSTNLYTAKRRVDYTA